MNLSLHEDEDRFYNAADPNAHATIEKTHVGGRLYQDVNFGGSSIVFPKPYVFTLRAKAHNPNANNPRRACRSLVLYDNGGEQFLPSAKPDPLSLQPPRLFPQPLLPP